MEAWLALAEESFKAGRGTRTDIEDARSRLDMSRAKVTEAMMNLSVATRNFQVVTGMAAESIPDLDPRRLDPHRMVIKNSEDWLQRITENNPDIQSLRMQLKAARSYVTQMRSGHLPTVDFVATHRKSDSEYDTSIGQDYTTKYVGLQVTVPILSGGGVLALTRQAEAKEEKIHQSLVSTRRKVLSEAGRLYQACSQGSQLVQALNQAVISSEQAVVGEKKGVQAGTRTFVDALDAERRMYESMRDQAIAAYSLANNRLMFLALAAAIDLEAIETVSVWLSTASR
jgi:outer membrane protein, protease secretion system